MKSLVFKLCVFSIFIIALSACKTQTTFISAYHTPDIECLGVEHDGSQTLRSYGMGKNKKDAVEQAKKNAVREVVFKGIRSGMPGCNTRPILTEVNAEQKYEEYFNDFFKDGGLYKDFVTSIDEKSNSKTSAKASTHVNYVVTVTVLRNQLKEQFIQDNILK